MPTPARLLIPLLLLAAGCGSTLHDTYNQGPVDRGDYRDAVAVNDQRIAGEDKLVDRSLVDKPFDAFDKGYDSLIGAPFTHLWDYLTHDTPALAARRMLDPASADNRRSGTLRMTDFAFARQGEAIKVYAHQAIDPDYTVRAAGIRALNRCRATGYTDLFLKSLEDDLPLVRMEAAKALANIPDDKAIPALISHLQHDVSKDVRIACADALRNFKNIDVATALVGVLEDEEFSVAWQARQSLAMLTGMDYRYDEKAWLSFISTSKTFG